MEKLLIKACKNDKKALKFVEDVILFLKKNSLKLLVSEGQSVDCSGSQTSGYFSSEDKELGIAIGKDISLWLPILLHERCHAQQFVDDSNWFQNLENSCNDFFDWIAKKKTFTSEEIEKHIQNIMLLESDCEKRSVNNILNFELDYLIESKSYAQKANAYVTFYKFMLTEHKWYKTNQEPYSLEEIWSKFPTEVVLMGCELTPELAILYKKCVE